MAVHEVVSTAPVHKTLVCLARSRKSGGYCVAGRELENGALGAWVRPVPSSKGGTVEARHLQTRQGFEISLGDIFEATFSGHVPGAYQTENWLIAPEYEWQLLGAHPLSSICESLERPSALWGPTESSQAGHNDRIPERVASDELDSSLLLVEGQDVEIYRTKTFDRARIRARFTYAGTSYDVRVTDPRVESAFYVGPENGRCQRDRLVLCVSLSEPYDGYVYRLVASVIAERRIVPDA